MLKPLLEAMLLNWRDWMRSGDRPDRLPNHAFSCAPQHTDFDSMCEQMDINLAMITNAAIDDLVPMQAAALHNAYLHSVFRFRVPLHVIVPAAKMELQGRLERKGVYLGA